MSYDGETMGQATYTCSECGARLLHPVMHEGRIWGEDCLATALGLGREHFAYETHDDNGVRVYDAARVERTAAERSAKHAAYLADEASRAERAEIARAHYVAANAWLIEVLRGNGPFADSIATDLEGAHPDDVLGGRAFNIVCDIYAKAFGRRGSKANAAAVETFYETIEATARVA